MDKWLSQLNFNASEWEFEFQQRDAHAVLMADLWLRSLYENFAAELKLDINSPDYLFTGSYKGYIKTKNKKEILKKYIAKVEDTEYLSYVFKRTMSVMEEFDSVADLLLSDQNSSSFEKWCIFEEKFLEVIPWFYIPWLLTEENIISDRIKLGLEKYRTEIEKITDFNNALGVLLFPAKKAEFQKEQKSFYEIAEFASQNEEYEKMSEFQKKAEMHIENYAWMKTFILLPIEPTTYNDLLKNIKEALENKGLDEYKLQQKKKEENIKLSARLRDIFINDDELLKNILMGQELAWLLTSSVEKALFTCYKLIPFYKKIALDLGVGYENWVHLKIQEIKERLSDGKTINSEDIEERKISYVAMMIDGRINWAYGEKAKEISSYIDTHIGKTEQRIENFKGNCGYPGKVIGTVCIALSPFESRKIEEGQILVTSMTSPDYVPAMRKSGAIVTNEGGLLCHAAIVARELGKPCIIGTKIATKVLKDGDMIEVDAEKGIVRIL